MIRGPKRFQKGFKKVEVEYPLERLKPYENDTAAWLAA
jgi:hypothetical protein